MISPPLVLEIPKIHVADIDRIALRYKALVRDVQFFDLGGLYALARKKAKQKCATRRHSKPNGTYVKTLVARV